MTVAPPVLVTPLPPALTVTAGDELRLTVTAQAPGGETLTYVWTKDGTDVGVDGPTVAVAQATATEQGTWTVSATVRSAAGEASDPVTSTCMVTVTAAPPPAGGGQGGAGQGGAGQGGAGQGGAGQGGAGQGGAGQGGDPLVWDAPFARALTIAGAAMLLILLPVLLIVALTGDVVRLTVVGLLALAVVLTVTGVVMAVIDLRGRSRLVESAGRVSGRGGLPADVVKELPSIIEKFGALRLASAVLLLAAVAMVCVTTIAVQSLPGPDPEPDPTTSTSETAT